MSRTHCKHGTYVGHPGGPDYMCGYCEDGVTDEEWATWKKEEARSRRAETKEALSSMVKAVRVLQKDAPTPTIFALAEKVFINTFCNNGVCMRSAQLALAKVKALD